MSTLRRFLPGSIKRAIQRGLEWADLASVRLFAANRFTAGLYYFLFSRRFDREHLAVLKGRVAYYRDLQEIKSSSPLLRRNVHRLEKGLIMRPRRKIFAEAYILETVRCYNRAKARNGFSANELRWARDVLDEYFAVVERNQVTGQAWAEYSGAEGEVETAGEAEAMGFKPYPLAKLPVSPVSFDQVATLFLKRRSVRWYKQQPVPLELLHRAINVAALAPSACNRQPFRFIVAKDSPTAARIAKCAGGTTGFADQLPALIVVVGDLSAYPKERDRHLIYIDAALASMQLMLAAETLELSTCSINWPDIDRAEERLQKILKLPAHERVIMLMAVGYGDPSGGVPYSQKKQGLALAQEFSLE